MKGIDTLDSGCGPVASDTKDPRFESSQQQNLYLGTLNHIENRKDRKRPGIAIFRLLPRNQKFELAYKSYRRLARISVAAWSQDEP